VQPEVRDPMVARGKSFDGTGKCFGIISSLFHISILKILTPSHKLFKCV
jgi:hypothetical protein